MTTYDCIRRYGPWSWGELAWAMERNLIDINVLKDYAEEREDQAGDPDIEDLLRQLDGADSYEQAVLAKQLVRLVEGVDEEAVARKWLVAMLGNLYEKRDTLADPLGEVERIYADFDYPECMESFVRYMPPADGYVPESHSHDQNIARLFTNWQAFVSEARRVL
ncbi:DUF2247 family protein [Stenotrophomonas sp. NPDC077464]|uniref:DUF2247 family protein n=1 Tax=unclassified Stenotrophomonas TaxID=196198 RepID=UPI0037D12763